MLEFWNQIIQTTVVGTPPHSQTSPPWLESNNLVYTPPAPHRVVQRSANAARTIKQSKIHRPRKRRTHGTEWHGCHCVYVLHDCFPLLVSFAASSVSSTLTVEQSKGQRWRRPPPADRAPLFGAPFPHRAPVSPVQRSFELRRRAVR